VGVIGASPRGSWGARAHLPALKASPAFEVTAICNSSLESARQAAAMFGAAHAFADVGEMVAHPDIDLVVVCLRVASHYEPVMAALDAGKHVYCEWPLAVDTAQAEAMAAHARAKGVTHMVGLQSRAAPVINHVRNLVAQGYIGELKAASLLHSAPWQPTPSRATTYMQDARSGSTFMSIPTGHAVDALCYALGEFRQLSATVATLVKEIPIAGTEDVVTRTSPDQIMVQGSLVNGAMASVHMQGSGVGTGFRFEINGTKKTLVVTPASPGPFQLSALRLFEGAQGTADLSEEAIPETLVRAPGAPAGPSFNLAQMYANLAQAIRDGRPAEPDFETAVLRHKTLDAIQRASDSGRAQILS
jgi:predicted dehydrogenase